MVPEDLWQIWDSSPRFKSGFILNVVIQYTLDIAVFQQCQTDDVSRDNYGQTVPARPLAGHRASVTCEAHMTFEQMQQQVETNTEGTTASGAIDTPFEARTC